MSYAYSWGEKPQFLDFRKPYLGLPRQVWEIDCFFFNFKFWSPARRNSQLLAKMKMLIRVRKSSNVEIKMGLNKTVYYLVLMACEIFKLYSVGRVCVEVHWEECGEEIWCIK
jgi:hypothetical protein